MKFIFHFTNNWSCTILIDHNYKLSAFDFLIICILPNLIEADISFENHSHYTPTNLTRFPTTHHLFAIASLASQEIEDDDPRTTTEYRNGITLSNRYASQADSRDDDAFERSKTRRSRRRRRRRLLLESAGDDHSTIDARCFTFTAIELPRSRWWISTIALLEGLSEYNNLREIYHLFTISAEL